MIGDGGKGVKGRRARSGVGSPKGNGLLQFDDPTDPMVR